MKTGPLSDDYQEWESKLNIGISAMLDQKKFTESIGAEHLKATPSRVVKAYKEYFWGLDHDPAAELATAFEEKQYDEMVVISGVQFTSWCAHHLLPFIGRYTFAYLPKDKVIGLSKIPRFIEVLAARPQVQEHLCQEVIDIFQKTVLPHGSGIIMDAVHTCMSVRGVKTMATTRTIALSRLFKKDASVKQELLMSVGPTPRHCFLEG